MERQIPRGMKITFLVHFIVGLVFGILYLLIPETTGNLLGLSIEDTTVYRLLGAAILGFTTSSWLAYRETAWDKVKIVVQMEIAWTVLGTLASLWGLLFAGYPAAGWLNAVILAGFAVAFGVFYSQAERVAAAPAGA